MRGGAARTLTHGTTCRDVSDLIDGAAAVGAGVRGAGAARDARRLDGCGRAPEPGNDPACETIGALVAHVATAPWIMTAGSALTGVGYLATAAAARLAWPSEP
ncbi:MAG TPA: hypothetical protein VIK12_03785, partial [Pengzhenrongella sp.]